MKKLPLLLMLAALMQHSIFIAQEFAPGFNKEEYLEMLRVSVQTTLVDEYIEQFESPVSFYRAYQSPVMGLDNYYDLWLNEDRTAAVISIRGTTPEQDSWLENIYAAMIPARGTLQLAPNEMFDYTLAMHPDAAVHAGWTVGMAFIARDVIPKIRDLSHRKIRNIYIVGHSQGGAIAYLLTAHLLHMQKEGTLSEKIRFKTYCSAAPKPGNLYFAYNYEALTQNGWAYNVVNSADWVPEVPISVQTFDDFNRINPFLHVDALIRAQKLPQRIVARHIYNHLDKPTRKAQQRYQKYLGELTERMVQNRLEGLILPPFVASNNYVRTGTTIVLQPDDKYREKYPDDPKEIFGHHQHSPYIFLAEKMETPFFEAAD
ncbi:MAG: lipase family protein [Cryomorphaceae bacterium]|nr:MAG: lipase family protein [Cryomorphaceae bacterium]